jgi:NAD(P)-dependent dehydrogenase (short-subunit alcohol dehydrogenase family)
MILEGKIAVVTGAGRGIGRAIVLAMARNGADVAVADIVQENIEKVVKEVNVLGRQAIGIPTNVLEQVQIEAMIEQTYQTFGRLDILVNCAGNIVLKSFLNTPVETYRKQMDLHYMATVIACKAAAPIMIKQGGGKIISMSSISGTIGYDDHSAYSPAKGAIIRFSEAIASELKIYNINVNCIAPNAVDTTLFDEWMAETHTKIDRTGWIQPDEIGELAVFLSSPAARSITGSTIVLQGIYKT